MSDSTVASASKGAAQTQEGARNQHRIRTDFIRGLGWTSVAKWGGQLISWPATLLIARHLMPSDYGYLALVTVWTRVIMLLTEGGFSAAIILGPRRSAPVMRQLHTFATLLGLAAALLGVLVAFPIADYYDSPPLKSVMMGISLTFILEGVMLVPSARLRRQMRFRELAYVDVARTIVDACVGLTLALLGAGYWALVGQYAAGILTSAILILYLARISWNRPTLTDIRPVIRHGRLLMTPSAAAMIYGSADYAVAGKLLGPSVAGVYGLAWTIVGMPSDKLLAILTRVAPSLFGSVKKDVEALRFYTVEITHALAAAMFPCFAGIALTAPLFVPLLLGEKWNGIIPPLQLLCVHAGLRAAFTVVPQSLQAAGKGRIVLENGLFALGIYVPGFVLFGTHFGARGLAVAWCVGTPLLLARLWHALAKSVGIPRGSIWRLLWAPALSTGIMAAAIVGCRVLLQDLLGRGETLLLMVGVGIASYLASLAILDTSAMRNWLRQMQRPKSAIRTPSVN
jgi:teichuronic acid exporter